VSRSVTDKKILRRTAALAVTGILLLVSVFVCVGIGSVKFTLSEVVRALFCDDASTAHLLIMNLRLPRILCCCTVGICLSLSGCILQSVMRNTMASPSTIGVTGGASFAGYLMLCAMPGLSRYLPVGSIIGAFVTTMLIYALAYRRGVSPVRMILSGLAVSALFGALNDAIRTFFADSLGNVSGFLVGGFNGCSWDSFFMILPFTVVGVTVCAFLPSAMNILMLGDETAASLGLRTEFFRFVLIVVSSLLSGAAIAVCGLIGFVGLIVPHISRLIVGSDHRWLMPMSSMLGALLLVVCDTVGRVIMPPGEVPVSIILSLIGAPFFLWLLRSRDNSIGGES